jgi:hypothetical protein
VLTCSKKSYPTQWSAERALAAIKDYSRSHGRTPPTGSYWCAHCKTWHLTSKSKSRTPSWLRKKHRPAYLDWATALA